MSWELKIVLALTSAILLTALVANLLSKDFDLSPISSVIVLMGMSYVSTCLCLYCMAMLSGPKTLPGKWRDFPDVFLFEAPGYSGWVFVLAVPLFILLAKSPPI